MRRLVRFLSAVPFALVLFGSEANAQLPPVFTWPSTPILNIGQSGSSFITVDTFNNVVYALFGVNRALSTQFVIDCTGEDTYTNGSVAYGTLLAGAPLASCYPFSGPRGTCWNGCAKYSPPTSWAYVGNPAAVPPVADIKNYMYSYGPIFAKVYAETGFVSYRSGVFNGTAVGSPNLNVTLVGWDDNVQAWRLRNHWGTTWGEAGYMRIRWGSQQVGYGAAWIKITAP